MGRLLCIGTTSLDGYVNDASGAFDFTAPSEEQHAFVNDRVRPVGTFLFGRRVYEVMTAWETIQSLPDVSPAMLDFARIWDDADKIVYSRSLPAASTSRTRIEREFDPDAVARLKEDSDRDISIGGPTLAAAAIAAGLVDEYQVFVAPVLVGGGTRFFPDGVGLDLELADERRFHNGVVFLAYRPRR